MKNADERSAMRAPRIWLITHHCSLITAFGRLKIRKYGPYTVEAVEQKGPRPTQAGLTA
jgi:hypothetical protein